MRVVRIEHERGHGPYMGLGMNEAYIECGYAVPDAWASDSRHPTPLVDAGLRDWWSQVTPSIQYEYLFAFADEAQMRAWVGYPEVMTVLRGYGYVLAEYECEDRYVKHGAKQSVFNQHRAKRVSTRPLEWA